MGSRVRVPPRSLSKSNTYVKSPAQIACVRTASANRLADFAWRSHLTVTGIATPPTTSPAPCEGFALNGVRRSSRRLLNAWNKLLVRNVERQCFLPVGCRKHLSWGPSALALGPFPWNKRGRRRVDSQASRRHCPHSARLEAAAPTAVSAPGPFGCQGRSNPYRFTLTMPDAFLSQRSAWSMLRSAAPVRHGWQIAERFGVVECARHVRSRGHRNRAREDRWAEPSRPGTPFAQRDHPARDKPTMTFTPKLRTVLPI